jgi:hypothetical protein
MPVIEAQRVSILVPHDHRHINQMRMTLGGYVPWRGLAMSAVRASRRRDDRPSCDLCQPMVSRRRYSGVMWNSPQRGPRWFTQRGLICGNSLWAGSSWISSRMDGRSPWSSR